MKRAVLLGSLSLAAAGLTGCQDAVIAPVGEQPLRASFALQSATLATGLERGAPILPGDALAGDLEARRAINPGDYICVDTDISAWWLTAALDVRAAEQPIFDLLYFDLLADLVVTYDALYFQTDATPQYFGYEGEYTQVMQKTHKDIKRFWDIPTDEIQLVGMHGSMLLDQERVARVYNLVFGVPAGTAQMFAAMVHDALSASQGFNGGNHPLFSFNAFAISAGSIGRKIVMGDGILAGYEALGFGDVAPQAVYAHEFAHHIQFTNGYFNDEITAGLTAPERTRYTELMADAMSAYYLTHARGATLRQQRVEQFLQAFYEIGDCGYTSSGHHGTPNQRMAAAHFGFSIADQAQKQGHILGAEQFYELFKAAYPGIIAPDAF